jgi:hypothetical protein
MTAHCTLCDTRCGVQAFITLRENGVSPSDPNSIRNFQLIKPSYLTDSRPLLKEIRHWAGMRCVQIIDMFGWHELAAAFMVETEAQVSKWYTTLTLIVVRNELIVIVVMVLSLYRV